MRSCDVAVIGSGVFGAWIAYWLTKEGRRVALVDAYGAASSRASSGGETRILRLSYGADELYTRMAMRSLELWGEFIGRTGQALFRRTGALVAAAAGDAGLRASREALAGVGAPHEELSAGELRRRFPQMRFDGEVEALLEPMSGALMARRLTHEVAEAARRAGAEPVRELVEPPEGERRLDAVKTASGGRMSAEIFVFACGPWLKKVFPRLLGDRIFPTRQEVFFFGAPAGDARFGAAQMPVWLDRTDERLAYGVPDIEQRGLKVAFDAHGAEFDPDSGERLVSAGAAGEAREYVARRFPALCGAPLVESRVCQYENTSNGDFVLDRHPELENVWIAGGGSGHGFKHGPAVGEYVADLIAGRGEREPRFALAAKRAARERSVY